MRVLVLVAVLSLQTSLALAQQASTQSPSIQTMKSYASSAEVAAVVAKLKSERKESQPLAAQSLLRLAPYNVSIEYRVTVGPAAIHDRDAELFYVIDGAATLVTGGTLANGKRTNAENQSGTAIDGGSHQEIAKGDFVIVPEGVAHWFSAIRGSVTLMSLHLPRSTSQK